MRCLFIINFSRWALSITISIKLIRCSFKLHSPGLRWTWERKMCQVRIASKQVNSGPAWSALAPHPLIRRTGPGGELRCEPCTRTGSLGFWQHFYKIACAIQRNVKPNIAQPSDFSLLTGTGAAAAGPSVPSALSARCSGTRGLSTSSTLWKRWGTTSPTW